MLGCLLEKRWTTPDQYPLTLNALRLACNQSTNRDPVTRYDEPTVRDAAQRLCKYGIARLASGHSSRATKYRHLAEEALGLGREQLAVLCVLLLRGRQTPGELKARSERMASIESLEHVERVLDSLFDHGFARRLPRRPGQKEDRYEQLLGGEGGAAAEAGGDEDAGMEAPGSANGAGAYAAVSPTPRSAAPAPAVPAPSAPAPSAPAPSAPAPGAPASAVPDASLERRVAALEAALGELREELADLHRRSAPAG